MSATYTLMSDAKNHDVPALLAEWKWLIPESDTPLFISAFGDWVFGKPNGSLWVLSLLEGTYEQVAKNSAEYNSLNKSEEWLNRIFIAEWLPIAIQNGLSPGHDECLGWKLHPLLGGKFEVSNLQVFSMLVYQSVVGQLLRQLSLRQPQPPEAPKKPWFKFW
ncbi:T6SS immunity protein Tdi1 domain-containing protein [Uliginosibacterium sp. TH139]|uniref:T6SS immunity protein Tdi1 domain-containing protein n=1 Tax=Uliginosibacterium sp. TH139 TaxID=2067453 RepID=UPI000C79CC99|nr:T6SS immunity protein Tdi1 domain-containing protein [Uliginosibacterium sp. TH139]PLK46950.1 hypothetical protein C0V76_19295 [Uliginosibacterium sp. TH139]